METSAIQIHSEIGTLKKVLLHRPGRELENLMPEYLERLLFDDIPYLKIAQEEHDAFADLLRSKGAEVVYLTDLVAESISSEDVKEEFIREYLWEADIRGSRRTALITEYFKDMSTKNMVIQMIEGIRKSDLDHYHKKNLMDYLEDDYPFLIDPMPNLYFTRDPFACIGNGVSIHNMHTETRSRETIFAKYIFRYNPKYSNTPLWYDRREEYSIEGGDILVLSDKVIAVGISQRTHPHAIELFAKKILSASSDSDEGMGFQKVLAVDIPKSRSFMHLDTVFTMVDRDKFTMHPSIRNEMSVFVLQKDKENKLHILEEHETLENILKEHLELEQVTLIKCGGGSPIDAAREQWNDGSNTLAIAPGEVIVYSRNHVTNQVLQENGIKTWQMPSSELSRGRGGPRCMSMPLVRAALL